MPDASAPMAPFVNSIFHPSDFSEGSRGAFAHALAVALRRQASLTMLHVVGEDRAVDVWTDFPSVRGTLERWGLLEEGSPREAVFEKLGMKVTKINARGHGVLPAMLRYLDETPTDLIVLATEGREGLPSWSRPSVAEKVARRAETKTLFVPHGARGFVDPATGSVSLRRILVPVDREPRPHQAVEYAARAAVLAERGPVEITLLHVGEPGGMPAIDPPESDACNWKRDNRSGDVVEQIVAAASETEADLIVMATQGRDGILDALRGSVTERVLRSAACTLLAVPSL